MRGALGRTRAAAWLRLAPGLLGGLLAQACMETGPRGGSGGAPASETGGEGAGDAGEAETPACGAEVTSPAIAVVGTGETSFQEIGPGAGVALHGGPQGGYHVYIAVRCQGLGPDAVVAHSVHDAETKELMTWSSAPDPVELDPAAEWSEVAGLFAFLETDEPEHYLGRRVVLTADVVDDCHRSARDVREAEVTAVVPWGATRADPGP